MDIYQHVTDSIVAALERGTPPWVKPWTVGSTPHSLDANHATGRAYSGVNLLALWAQRELRGFTSNEWMTFKQARARGAMVRKGETGAHIVFWKFQTVHEPDVDDPRQVPLARAYTVFNLDQVDGIERPEPAPETPLPARLRAAERFCANTGAVVKHGGTIAAYSPSRDAVRMPPRRAFESPEHYFATKLHELTHWTGHPSRCDRLRAISTGRFGDDAYAVEELIAELGAAFACAELGVPGELRHASYLDHWLKVLRSDKRAIFTAASHARTAHEYLKSLQPAAAVA